MLGEGLQRDQDLTQGNSKSHTQKREWGVGGGMCFSHQKQRFIYSSALPGKCDRFHEEHSGFNVLFKCIQQKVEAFRIY